MEQIAMVLRRRWLEWFEHVKRRHETEIMRAVGEMTTHRKVPTGRPRVQCKG